MNVWVKGDGVFAKFYSKVSEQLIVKILYAVYMPTNQLKNTAAQFHGTLPHNERGIVKKLPLGIEY